MKGLDSTAERADGHHGHPCRHVAHWPGSWRSSAAGTAAYASHRRENAAGTPAPAEANAACLGSRKGS